MGKKVNNAQNTNKQNNEQNMGEQNIDEQIILFDENGKEQPFDIIAIEKDGDVTYLLAMESFGDDEDDYGDNFIVETNIVHFKCIATEGDDMVFEIMDEDHPDFEKVLSLFAQDYVELGIEL